MDGDRMRYNGIPCYLLLNSQLIIGSDERQPNLVVTTIILFSPLLALSSNLMKPLKLILPDIHKKSNSHNSKSKPKFYRPWPMRDTFTNWEKNNRKQRLHEDPLSVPNPYGDPKATANTSTRKREREVSKQSQSTCGMTLEEYFREAVFTLPNQNQYHPAEQSILPYIEHNFLIQETDEEQFSEPDVGKKMGDKAPFRDAWIDKGSFTKVLRSSVGYSKHKMKTEQVEPHDSEFQRIGKYSSKKKIMTICRSRDKFLRMQQSFELKQPTDRHKYPLNHSTLKGKNSTRQITQKTGLTTKQNKQYNIEAVTKSAIRLKLEEAGFREKPRPSRS